MPVETYEIRGWAGQAVRYDGAMRLVQCPSCHITHGIPEELNRRAVQFNSKDYPGNRVSVYCPNGHSWSYTGEDTALEKARARAKALEESLAWTQDRLNETRAARDHAEAQARGYKGAMVKQAKRVRAGVCPHCNRSGFEGDRLVRHINAKHPAEVNSDA